MTGPQVAQLVIASCTPLFIVATGAAGYALQRLIRQSDSAATVRHAALVERLDRIERDIRGVTKRHDEALIALNDLIREGFDLAATERYGVARGLGERLARVEGKLGWPSLEVS